MNEESLRFMHTHGHKTNLSKIGFIEKYVETERLRLQPLTTIEAHINLESELTPDDALFQFGKNCGYAAALCTIDNMIKAINKSEHEHE